MPTGRRGAARLFNLNVQPGTYFTILVSEKDGQPAIEVIHDTPEREKLTATPAAGSNPPPKEPPTALVVRQFIPDARITVATDRGNRTTGELSYRQTETLEDLPAGLTKLNIKATFTDRHVETSYVEADLTRERHATLLLMRDLYDRFRPRVVPNGESHESTEPGEPAAKPTVAR